MADKTLQLAGFKSARPSETQDYTKIPGAGSLHKGFQPSFASQVDHGSKSLGPVE